MLSVGSCFSGIGGLELGFEWTGGFETKWQIEQDEYASRVLAKHWPSVKRYRDIRDVVRPEPVDLICGGFPCQDVSLAGKRKGLEGKRSTLWSEMFRLVCEVKPRWIVAENVPGLLSSDNGRFFGNILRDLANARYDAEWGTITCCEVGGAQLRKRLFIIAHPNGQRWDCMAKNKKDRRTKIYTQSFVPWWNKTPFLHGGLVSAKSKPSGRVGRNDDGLPEGLDRLKCLGNAVVPQVAQKIGEMILMHESIKGGT